MLPPIPYVDWITAVLTITYMQLMAMKKGAAWPLGIVTQFVWIYMSLQREMYGLVALSCILIVQCVYGWWNWKKPQNDPEELMGQ